MHYMHTFSLSPGCLQLRIANTHQLSTSTSSSEVGISKSRHPVSENDDSFIFKATENLKSERRTKGAIHSTKPTTSPNPTGRVKNPSCQKDYTLRMTRHRKFIGTSMTQSNLVKPETDKRFTSNTSYSSAKALILSPEGRLAERNSNIVRNGESLVDSVILDKKRHSVCEIQALSRGFLGRAHYKIRRLMKRLVDLQEKQRQEILQIETHKKNAMIHCDNAFEKTLRYREAKRNSHSETITIMLTELQDARETNARLKRALVDLKQTNQELVIKNTQHLMAAARCEGIVNHLQRRALELRCIAYGCLQCLQSIQESDFFHDYYCTRNEIQRMILLAEKEDDLLL